MPSLDLTLADACFPRRFMKCRRAQDERMTSQHPDQERKADHAGQEPMCQARQRTPQRQVWSVVHVERREEQDVRHGHAGNVHRQPAMPEPTLPKPPRDSSSTPSRQLDGDRRVWEPAWQRSRRWCKQAITWTATILRNTGEDDGLGMPRTTTPSSVMTSWSEIPSPAPERRKLATLQLGVAASLVRRVRARTSFASGVLTLCNRTGSRPSSLRPTRPPRTRSTTSWGCT